MNVYVLTMLDRNDDYNFGVYNEVFSTMEKAVTMWNRLMQEEVDAGIINRDDLRIHSVGYSQTADGRFSWTIDERTVK